MTEVSLHAPRFPFSNAAQQQQQQQTSAVPTPPLRWAVQGNETFIPRGTPAADLNNLFPKRER